MRHWDVAIFEALAKKDGWTGSWQGWQGVQRQNPGLHNGLQKSKGQAHLCQLPCTVCQQGHNLLRRHRCRKSCWRLWPIGSVGKLYLSASLSKPRYRLRWHCDSCIPVWPADLLSRRTAGPEAAAWPLSLSNCYRVLWHKPGNCYAQCWMLLSRADGR